VRSNGRIAVGLPCLAEAIAQRWIPKRRDGRRAGQGKLPCPQRKSDMSEMLKGNCLCGQVTVTMPREGATSAICHCRHCQKQTGSAYSTVLIAAADTAVVNGTLAVTRRRRRGRPSSRSKDRRRE
jgi:hypothetical protein